MFYGQKWAKKKRKRKQHTKEKQNKHRCGEICVDHGEYSQGSLLAIF
jgi:hypothetical protein